MIKYCPDLTSYKGVKAIMVGQGDFTRPILHACIKEECVAYSSGKCLKYHNAVEKEVKEDEIRHN